jgi:hypothetical protein
MALPPLSRMDDRTPGLHRPVVHRFRAKPGQLSQFDRAMGGRSRPPDAARAAFAGLIATTLISAVIGVGLLAAGRLHLRHPYTVSGRVRRTAPPPWRDADGR